MLRRNFIFLLLLAVVRALEFELDDYESIKKAQALVIEDMLNYYPPAKYYKNGKTPKDSNDKKEDMPELGMFQEPYYWWQAGIAFNAMLDYDYYTDNDTWTALIKDALLAQTGENWDFEPASQATVEGNDDQLLFTQAAMTAAERNFSNPDSDQPSWLYLSQAVFQRTASRWETGSCGGGLRWQIHVWNAGWQYKNSISNGGLFLLGARLARYTGNNSYAEFSEKIWNWERGVKLIDHYFNNDTLAVFDGARMSQNCSTDTMTRLEWTYNAGVFIAGCAYMANHTNNTIWIDRARLIWQRARVFFHSKNQILYEAACQPSNQCNEDQRFFKGVFAQFLGLAVLMAPDLNDEIYEYLNATAPGMARSCTGGYSGTSCGQNWFFTGKGNPVPDRSQLDMIQHDGKYGFGEQFCALALLNSYLVHRKPPPLSIKTGGTSEGDASTAGSTSHDDEEPTELPIETKDKAGASVITVIIVLVQIGCGAWLMF